jgi:hypothetical protein
MPLPAHDTFVNVPQAWEAYVDAVQTLDGTLLSFHIYLFGNSLMVNITVSAVMGFSSQHDVS